MKNPEGFHCFGIRISDSIVLNAAFSLVNVTSVTTVHRLAPIGYVTGVAAHFEYLNVQEERDDIHLWSLWFPTRRAGWSAPAR